MDPTGDPAQDPTGDPVVDVTDASDAIDDAVDAEDAADLADLADAADVDAEPDPCDSIPATGECDDGTLRYCTGADDLMTFDCEAAGGVCNAGCEDLPVNTTCNDEILRCGEPFACSSGEPRRCESPTNLAFTTSRGYTGDLLTEAEDEVGGTFSDPQAAADALCNFNASEAGLAGTFVAGLANSTSDIFEELSDSDGPWVRLDGEPVAQSAAEMQNGRFFFDIGITELGQPIDESTNPTHWMGQSFDCQDWTSADSGEAGSYGSPVAVGSSWLFRGNPGCGTERRLACAQTGSDGEALDLPTPPGDARYVFVTSTAHDTDFGAGGDAHAEADALCQSELPVGSSRTFRAYVSVTDSAGVDYFEEQGMNGPWYNGAGFEIAADRDALENADRLGAHLNYDVDGNFVEYAAAPAERVMTGGYPDTADNCADFTSASGDDSITYGSATFRSTEEVFALSIQNCNGTYRLYCFEE